MQGYISLAIVVCAFLSAQFFKIGVLHNIAWVLVGLLFAINPVWPKMWDWANHDDLRKGIRIGSTITRSTQRTRSLKCRTRLPPSWRNVGSMRTGRRAGKVTIMFPYLESLLSFLELNPEDWEPLIQQAASDLEQFFTTGDAAHTDRTMQTLGELGARHIYFQLLYLRHFERRAKKNPGVPDGGRTAPAPGTTQGVPRTGAVIFGAHFGY